MKKTLALLFFPLLVFSCSSPNKEQQDQPLREIKMEYAVGFRIWQGEDYKIAEVTRGFPGDHQAFKYFVPEKEGIQPPHEDFDAVVPYGVEKVILTSTTQIPHLDTLELANRLIAFPNCDLISSPAIRKRIAAGQVEELGGGAHFNSEKIIDLSPDLLMISTLGDNLKDLQLFQKAGIPAVINGDYVEQHPLGRAEWIKFTGVLTGNYDQAAAIFEGIAQNYLTLKSAVAEADFDSLPTVLSGSMYRDIWYAPAGNNWGAIFLEDAGAEYVFEDMASTGSLQLNYESVLEKGLEADYWISTAEYTTLDQMKTADERYTQFRAFQKGNIYSFASTRGATGGLEYFELGYTRPDIILKDLVKVFHPELVQGYSPYFYHKLH